MIPSFRLHTSFLVTGLTLLCIPPMLFGDDKATGARAIARKVFQKLDKAPAIPGAALGERKISMRARFPNPMDQGNQQSCTACATAYALRTFLERKRQGWTDQDSAHLFSPAFVYNPFARGDKSTGIFVQDALTYLEGGGCCTLKTMPYKEQDTLTQATNEARKEAHNFRIAKWDTVDVTNLQKIKGYLAAENPIVIVAFVDTMNGEWAKNDKGVTDHYLTDGPKASNSERSGCHAMVVVGYDEDKQAFEVMNSWGPDWNDHGFGWVAYSFWPDWVNEGYVASNRTSDLPATSVSPKSLKWLPVGPEGLINGNWGYTPEIKLRDLVITQDKKLPPAVKTELASVLEMNR